MNIASLKATNLELTDAIRDYAVKRVESLEKLMQDFNPVDVDIEVGQTTKGQNKGPIFRAEINMQIPGTLLRAVEMGEDLYEAIDKVKDQLRRQIVDYKEKLADKNIRTPRPDKE